LLLEGILTSARYGGVLHRLRATPDVSSWFYRFDVTFEVTLRRHTLRDKAGSFGEDELRRWWQGDDPLLDADGRSIDRSITAADSIPSTIERIIADAGLTPGDVGR
jgi:hypothetical protein